MFVTYACNAFCLASFRKLSDCFMFYFRAQNLSNISTLNFMKDLDLDDENDDDYEVILKA